MDAMTLFEMGDVADRQADSGISNCRLRQVGMSGLGEVMGTSMQDVADCFWSPIQCWKAAFSGGDAQAQAAAWQQMKQPGTPVQPRVSAADAQPAGGVQAIRPMPTAPAGGVSTQDYIGPACPPAMVSGCKPPGRFEQLTCSCEMPGVPVRPVPGGAEKDKQKQQLMYVGIAGLGALALILLFRR